MEDNEERSSGAPQEREPEDGSHALPEQTERSNRWSRAEIAAVVLLTVIAALLRMWDLGIPDRLSFDETYYAKDACWYAFSSEDVCAVSDEQTKVHPPLGKWLISAGVKAFGYDSFGWRFVPALAGIGMVPLLFALARRLFRPLASKRTAFIATTFAAGLLTIDFLHLVQSRISMLDIFAAFFVLAAVLCLVIDRDRMLAGRHRAARMTLARPWRAAAGALGAAAAASKWSGAMVFGILILCAIAWEISARRRESGWARGIGRGLVEEGPSIVLYLVVLPLVLYMVTFLGRLDGEPFFSLPWSEGSWFRGLFARHQYMRDFHAELEATHPYQSPAWSWILLRRPVSYEFSSEGAYREVFAAGSPLVWWSSLLALVWAAIAWIRRRDFRRPEGLILAGFVFTYGPWLLPQLGRPAVFLFYLLPTIPFMCLALGYVAARLGDSWEARSAISLFAAGAVALFAFYFPLLTFRGVTQEEWRQRIWRFDNCEKPPGETTTTTITTEDDEGSPVVTTSETSEDRPPEGWCWI